MRWSTGATFESVGWIRIEKLMLAWKPSGIGEFAAEEMLMIAAEVLDENSSI